MLHCAALQRSNMAHCMACHSTIGPAQSQNTSHMTTRAQAWQTCPDQPLPTDTSRTAQHILLACTAFKVHNIINQTNAGAVAALRAAESGAVAAEQEPPNLNKKGKEQANQWRTLHGTAPTSTAIIYRKLPAANLAMIGLCDGIWCTAPMKKTDA